MLRTENTHMNMSGISHLEEKDLTLANMNGGFGGGNDFYISMNVYDFAEAAANKTVLFADLEAFIDQFLDVITDLKD